jgi:hypothetical protein
MEDAGSDRLKDALLGMLPENWRMYLVAAAVVFFVLSNPQAAMAIVGKFSSGVMSILEKLGIKLGGGATPTSPTSPTITDGSGIDAPLQSALSQISWAVKNGNAQVLDAGINSLKALVSAKAAAAVLLICAIGMTGMVGCSAGSSATKQASQGSCDYSKSHSFGVIPLSEDEKNRVYGAEPTLFEQEPDLAK